MRAAALLLTIALAGCRHAPLAYTVVHSGPRPLVDPPKPAKPELRVANARRSTRLNCDVHSSFADVSWKGRTASIRLHADDFFPRDEPKPGVPPGIRVTERMYTDSLDSIQKFRAELFARADQGCLTGPERADILRAITENSPLPTLIAYVLRFGTLGQEGFVELTDDFRLKVVGPAGSGYQIAYYSIARAPHDDRVRLTISSVTRSDQSPASPPFAAPESFGYARVLFWTTRSSADHFATILAAAGRPHLDDATKTFLAAPDGSCH